jgi:lipid-binding SYLF domain-containing protein
MILPAVASLRANEERLKNSAVVLDEMSTSVDKGIPTSLVQKAKCVAIIPGVKKAALGVGASVGLQIGGSDTDVILLVMNPRGVDRLLSSRFTAVGKY